MSVADINNFNMRLFKYDLWKRTAYNCRNVNTSKAIWHLKNDHILVLWLLWRKKQQQQKPSFSLKKYNTYKMQML